MTAKCKNGRRQRFIFLATVVAPAWKDLSAPLLAPLSQVREVSREIVFGVANQAQSEGLAEKTTTEELRARIEAKFWEPVYCPIVSAHRGV